MCAKMFINLVVLVHLVIHVIAFTSSTEKPHIVLIIADDLGWNDVGFHGSNEIPTPNIDALAYNGLILNRHYTQITCTPSRAALFTGKYPIRMGLQGSPIAEGIPLGVPLGEKLLPQYLKELGYRTSLVGKWHLGALKKEYTPNERGFDSFFGCYNGWVRYNDSVCGSALITNLTGIDARDNYEKAGHKFEGRYITDVYTEEAIDVIRKHDRRIPMFLDISFTAVHAIPKSTVQVKDIRETEERFAYIKDPGRRTLAGALATLDESVGKIILALHEKRMLRNSIVIFMSDNGGSTFNDIPGISGYFQNFASNWPLRGMKGTVVEGAVRCAAAIWSPLIRRREVIQGKMHLVDWLPTFYTAAGGNTSHLGKVDGVSQWEFLRNSEVQSPRRRLLVNINERTDEKAFIMGKWKYVKSRRNGRIRHGGSTGRDENLHYNLSLVLESPVHKALKIYKDKKVNEKNFLLMRKKANIATQGFCKNLTQTNVTEILPCFTAGCLFNINKDPCEMVDLSALYPKVVQNLKNALHTYQLELMPQRNCTKDPKANPKYFDNYWTPWVETAPTTCAI